MDDLVPLLCATTVTAVCLVNREFPLAGSGHPYPAARAALYEPTRPARIGKYSAVADAYVKSRGYLGDNARLGDRGYRADGGPNRKKVQALPKIPASGGEVRH